MNNNDIKREQEQRMSEFQNVVGLILQFRPYSQLCSLVTPLAIFLDTSWQLFG